MAGFQPSTPAAIPKNKSLLPRFRLLSSRRLLRVGWILSSLRAEGNRPRLHRHCHCVSRHILENLIDDMVGGDAFGFGFEVQNEAVAQGGGGGGFDVVEADVEAALSEGADFAGENQG